MTVAARFERQSDLEKALDAIDSRNGEAHIVEVMTPHPVPELEARLEPGHSPMGWIVLAAALTGATAAVLIQWLTAVDFPLHVGGRAVYDWPTYLVIGFESAVLAGGLAAFVGFFVTARLPRYHHPTFDIPDIETASLSDYWIIVRADAAGPVHEALRSAGGSVHDLEEA